MGVDLLLPEPDLIQKYNEYMSGVDRIDQNIEEYRISIRFKKWCWCLFSFLVDASVHNAFILYKRLPVYINQKLDHYEFRREPVRVYLTRFSKGATMRQLQASQAGPRRQIETQISPDLLFDGKDHFLVDRIVDGMKKQGRCRSCHGKSIKVCSKLKVPLHNKCFIQFHTR